jgi:hypothetical protein
MGDGSMQNEPSGWAIGWTSFAGLMMILGGGWWFISGFIAILNSDFYVSVNDYVFQFDATTWGWIHLLLGIVMLLAGGALFTAAVWARTVGVIIAVLWALVAFAWLPWHPVGAVLLIAISFSVMWSLTVHGHDITRA